MFNTTPIKEVTTAMLVKALLSLATILFLVATCH
jgi:hypothetical protein